MTPHHFQHAVVLQCVACPSQAAVSGAGQHGIRLPVVTLEGGSSAIPESSMIVANCLQHLTSPHGQLKQSETQ